MVDTRQMVGSLARMLRLGGLAALGALTLLSPGCGRRSAAPAVTGRKPGPAAVGAQKTPKVSANRRPPRQILPEHAQVELGEIVVADPQGKHLWRASAKVIEWDADKAVLRDVQCTFIDNDKTALEARAPVVTAYLKPRRVVLTGGVAARSLVTRTSLRADRLEWNVKDKEVYAAGNVKYVRGDFVITGARLRADLDLKRARLEGAVEMRAVEPFKSK